MNSEEILKHYLNTFATPYGEIVLQDLEEAFVKRDNPELEIDLEAYPHPYREYVGVGMRLVVQRIQTAIELAKGAKDE